jgi:IS6 family transposase
LVVDETYVKVAGKWRYVYRAIDERGQVIDVFVSPRRNITAARTFFAAALAAHGEPDEIITDLAQALETAIEQLLRTRFTTPSNTPTTASSAITAD